MSISSQIAADYGNRIKKEWQDELELAYESRDWEKVKTILDKMKEFYFSE